MRELKFRAWDYKEFRFLEQHEFTAYLDGTYLVDLPFGTVGVDDRRFEIMQYTGLKDKNGVEIFEGDIIEIFKDEHNTDYSDNPSVWVSVVIFNSMTACFEIEERQVGEFEEMYSRESFAFADYLAGEGHKSIKVIGNIYENKELIK